MKLYFREATEERAPAHAQFWATPFFEKTPFLVTGSILDALPPPSPLIPAKCILLSPSKEEWISLVEQALRAIASGAFEKVVLARKATFECQVAPNPFAVASALQEKSLNSTCFCIGDENNAFLGATPELLFSRKQNSIHTEAVAGTTKRGKTPLEDAMLESHLLQSSKMQREVFPVIAFLQEKLAPFCAEAINTSPIFVKKTPNVQHLCAKIQGNLLPNISDTDLLQALHPTPALLGKPSHAALQFLSANEKFDRNLYGGVLGWTTPEKSCYAALIRSCQIIQNKVHLYTGVGIVAGSNPEEEWEELNYKMALYKGIFYESGFLDH